jgi:polyadenylate-binding protein
MQQQGQQQQQGAVQPGRGAYAMAAARPMAPGAQPTGARQPVPVARPGFPQQGQQQQQRPAVAMMPNAVMPTAQRAEAAPQPSAADQSVSLLQQIRNAPPESHRNIVGERLFVEIAKRDATRASKITGMVLEAEKDLSELINMLEDPAKLSEIIDQAMKVLKDAGSA